MPLKVVHFLATRAHSGTYLVHHRNLVTWQFLDRQFLDRHSNPNPNPDPNPDPNPNPNPVQELTVQELTWYREILAQCSPWCNQWLTGGHPCHRPQTPVNWVTVQHINHCAVTAAYVLTRVETAKSLAPFVVPAEFLNTDRLAERN